MARRPGKLRMTTIGPALLSGRSGLLSGLCMASTPRIALCPVPKKIASSQKLLNRILDLAPRRRACRRTADQYYVERLIAKFRKSFSQSFPQTTLNPISDDSPTLLLAHDEANSASGCIGDAISSPAKNMEHRDTVCKGSPTRIDEPEISV
jgi:hypothetical protein